MERRLATTLTAGAALWALTLLVAPLALQRPWWSATATLVYQLASRVCHQRPERSFHLAGVQLPVCARCAGLYMSGAVAALAAGIGWQRRVSSPGATRRILLWAALPTALTVVLEFAGLVQTTNIVRAVSAVPLGAAAGWIFVRSLHAEAAVSR